MTYSWIDSLFHLSCGLSFLHSFGTHSTQVIDEFRYSTLALGRLTTSSPTFNVKLEYLDHLVEISTLLRQLVSLDGLHSRIPDIFKRLLRFPAIFSRFCSKIFNLDTFSRDLFSYYSFLCQLIPLALQKLFVFELNVKIDIFEPASQFISQVQHLKAHIECIDTIDQLRDLTISVARQFSYVPRFFFRQDHYLDLNYQIEKRYLNSSHEKVEFSVHGIFENRSSRKIDSIYIICSNALGSEEHFRFVLVPHKSGSFQGTQTFMFQYGSLDCIKVWFSLAVIDTNNFTWNIGLERSIILRA